MPPRVCCARPNGVDRNDGKRIDASKKMNGLILLRIRCDPPPLIENARNPAPGQADRSTVVLALDAVRAALHGLSSNELQHAIPNLLRIETNSFVCPNRFFQFL